MAQDATSRAPMAGVTWQSCLSNVLLFMLIAGMAGSCDARLFLTKFKAPKGMLAALFSQFVLLPAVGFASVTLFPQDAVTVVTLLVVTTSPGGGFSGEKPHQYCHLSILPSLRPMLCC